MKMYKLSVAENRLVSSIINDLTKTYKPYSRCEQYEHWSNEGIRLIRQRAKARGLMLDDTDVLPPTIDIRAIISSEVEKGGAKSEE